MAVTSPTPFDNGLSPQAEDTLMRFQSETFGEFLKKAREKAVIVQDKFWLVVNEIIDEINEGLSKNKMNEGLLKNKQKNKQIPKLSERTYANLERNGRYPGFEELEPIYIALSRCLGESSSFSRLEREHYVALAQARIAQRKKRPKKGYMPVASDWPALLAKLAAFDARRASERTLQRAKVPYLLPVPSPDTPQIRLSSKVVSLLNFNTSHVLERDRYVEEMMRQWEEEDKRLIVTKAMAGTGKTRAFYVLLKRIARMQNHWPFYYILSSSTQTPDDHLDSLLSSFAVDLQLSSEDEQISREERMEQIFAELTRCSKQGLRLAILVDDAHFLLASGTISAAWQQFFDLWIAREHTAVLCLATREWPHWKGRDRSFIKEIDLEPLSPAAGAEIWKRFGFGDVSEELREAASRKCGGYAQWIELRASDLDEPGHQYLWPKTSEGHYIRESGDNQHTQRIKAWLDEETIFDPFVDVSAREDLAQVFTRQLPHQVEHLLDLLVLAPLGVPLLLLQQEFDRPGLALDELKRCSLLDRDSLEQGRAALVSIAREARLYELSKTQRQQIEQHVTSIYTAWLYDLQQYQDDAEQAALIAELIVLFCKQQRFLQAAELLITYGWLCVQLGHIGRVERYALARSSSSLSPEVEVQRTFLQHRVLMQAGKKVPSDERYRVYQEIYNQVTASEITLQSTTEIHIAHEMWHVKIRDLSFQDGLHLLEETLHRMQSQSRVPPEIQAALNQSKARLLARWAESEESRGNGEKALELKLESVGMIQKTIHLWESYLMTSTSLLHRKSIELKLGRAYNDYAYRQRLLGNIDEAYDAIQKCLVFKQDKKAAGPRSLAVARGEYAQILAARGKLLEADKENDQALNAQQEILRKGDTTIGTDIGMLLVERGDIFMQQARTMDAKSLYKEGIKLIGGKKSRQRFTDRAQQQIQIIDATPYYRLDTQWAERYSTLLAYDDTDWVFPAGPFYKEEQQEWDHLFPHRHEDMVKNRMGTLVNQAKERELYQSFEEQREPRFHYPAIPIDEVRQCIAGFEYLLTDIRQQEKHAIVRKLYEKAIQQELTQLHLYRAIYEKDGNSAWECNKRLYGLPTESEMAVALRPFIGLLVKAQSHPKAGILAESLLKQMKTWNIDLDDWHQENRDREQGNKFDNVLVTPETAQRFFEDMLALYHFHDWRVQISSIRNIAHVAAHLRLFIIPDRKFSIRKLRSLLSEEVETHIYRAATGFHSTLTLLGTGTAGYKGTEEALAIHAEGQDLYSRMWLGTLATGLMAGVVNPPLSFSRLVTFLQQAFLTRNLYYQTYDADIAAEKAAKEEALRRALRTVRGAPDLIQVGTCSLLDRVYLQGYLDFLAFLKEGGDIQRLFIGKIGIDDLPDMAQIQLLTPPIPQRHLAENLDIYTHIRGIEERCKS
jgi:hypothetical protein